MIRTADSSSDTARKERGFSWLKLLLAVAAAVALIAVGRQAGAYVNEFAQWVETLGVWGPLIYIAGYSAAVVGFVPGSLLTLAGGAIFGLVAGTGYVFIAASLGACAAFLVARYVARGAIERKLSGNERFAAIDRAIASEGRKITFLLRLSPVFPFSLLNYALGLTRVRFGDYALACLGMLPGTILYVYLGSVVGDLSKLAGGETGAGDSTQRIILFAGLGVTAVVTILVTRIARRALLRATGEGASA